MAASSGSLDTSAKSHPENSFSFSSFMRHSFSGLVADDDYSFSASRRGMSERVAERSGSGVPKFKSIPPPSLPISSPPVSPSSYFAIPPGLSPTELLDSPVLLNASHILPSPTTGTIPVQNQSFNWKTTNSNSIPENTQTQQNIKHEDNNNSFSDFTFQTTTSMIPTGQGQGQQLKQDDDFSSQKAEYKPIPNPMQTNNNNQTSFYSNQQPQAMRENRKSEDGYNWRKYGQKQVKGSENPRSYYKCTFPNCPTKKKVERSPDGQITEIVYKGSHNHPKPQSTRRSSASSTSSSSSAYAIQPSSINHQAAAGGEMMIPDHSFSAQMMESATPDNSSVSFGDDDESQRSKSAAEELDEEEPDAKRWKKDCESEGISGAAGSRTVREPRVVVQTTSDIDILDDGYRWRKYGQKVVKGNPNPRSYYKCTHPGCPVRKHVERASHDLRAVITTYEGKHNHDVPAARGSGSHSLNRPNLPDTAAAATSQNNNTITSSSNNNMSMATMPSALHHSGNPATLNPIRGYRASEGHSPFMLDMLQSPGGGFEFSTFGSSMANFMTQTQNMDNLFPRTKEEPRDDMFLESLLC